MGTMQFIALIIGLIISVTSFLFSLWVKFRLEKKHYGLGMIREWNQQTAKDKIIIERTIPGIYEKCNVTCLDQDKLEKIYNAAYSKNKSNDRHLNDDSDIDYLATKESIIRLLNYFEFISSAYLNRAVDRKIIQDSFSGTMVRYYCALHPYIKLEIDKTKRNPWEPYTRFVKTVASRKHKYKLLTPCLKLDQNGDLVCENNPSLKLIGV